MRRDSQVKGRASVEFFINAHQRRSWPILRVYLLSYPILISRLCGCLLVTILPVALLHSNCEAQVNVPVPHSPHPNVQVARFSDTASAPETAFADASVEPLYDAAFSIRNNDQKEIVGICVIYTITDATGKTYTHTFRKDEFFTSQRNVVISPGGSLSVSPSGWVPSVPQPGSAGVSSSPISPGTVPGPGLQDIASRIASAQSVSASLDSIIFSDGSTWGPNLGRLNEDIVARKIAADYVLKLVTAALEGNQDWKPALKELLANRYDPETNFTQKWKSRFAQQLLLEQVPISAGIAFLKAIPAPMKFTNGQMLGGPATGVGSEK